MWSAMAKPTTAGSPRSMTGGQIQPALVSPDVGDVADVDAVEGGALRIEGAAEAVVMAVGPLAAGSAIVVRDLPPSRTAGQTRRAIKRATRLRPTPTHSGVARAQP